MESKELRHTLQPTTRKTASATTEVSAICASLVVSSSGLASLLEKATALEIDRQKTAELAQLGRLAKGD